jgi:hypothetical protein
MEGSPVVDIWIDEEGERDDVAIVESAGAMLDGAGCWRRVAGLEVPAGHRGCTAVSVRLTLQHLFRRLRGAGGLPTCAPRTSRLPSSCRRPILRHLFRGKMAWTGHTGTQAPQSMQVSGSM